MYLEDALIMSIRTRKRKIPPMIALQIVLEDRKDADTMRWRERIKDRFHISIQYQVKGEIQLTSDLERSRKLLAELRAEYALNDLRAQRGY